jgi:hypothetical protein
MSESDFTLPIDPAVREMGINNLDKSVLDGMRSKAIDLESKRLLDSHLAGAQYEDFRFIPLDELYETEYPDVLFRIGHNDDGGLWPTDGMVLLAAQAKAGKTTLVLNILYSLVTGERLMDKFPVQRLGPHDHVGVLNMEVSENQYKSWLQGRGVPNSYQLTIANLRGKAASVNLLDPEARGEFVKKLCAEDINILIVDPIGPILRVNGIDENDSVRVGQLLDSFNNLRDVTPLKDILIVHHGGHDVANQKNRPGISRGASAWNDIPDALWSYFKPDDESRIFKATGRDVDLEETTVLYDKATRKLTAGDVVKVDKTVGADGKPRTKITVPGKTSARPRRAS